MTADLEALVVAAYVFADEYPVPARPGRRVRVTDAELVALAVCQAAMGECREGRRERSYPEDTGATEDAPRAVQRGRTAPDSF